MQKEVSRRSFLAKSSVTMASLGIWNGFSDRSSKFYEHENIILKPAPERIKIGVIGINHGHIYSMTAALVGGGASLKSFYALEDDLAAEFQKRFPDAKRLSDPNLIYQDPEISMILSSAIPNQRASIAIKAMQNGKDVMVDKPGITDLSQLKQVKAVQKATGRIFSITYSERFENRATEKAGDLIKEGAIGKVLQTIGTGPHRMNIKSRPEWFFDAKNYGGIITDIASHQFDQFLFFTGSTDAQVVSSQIANFNHPQYPKFEDFGDVMIRGNKGTGYIRVDWFTPDGLKTWGDGKLIILGTEGYMEIRKNIDITKKDSGSHLYVVNNKETAYYDCENYPLTFGKKLVDDVINRTNTAMSQEHCFLAMELALKAQKKAIRLKL